MKYSVYILKSAKDQRRYIGVTRDLKRRLSEHNQGLVKSTRSRQPLELVHEEEFDKKSEALQREKFYKSGQGREYLKTVLNI
jgi:putative endonuclease